MERKALLWNIASKVCVVASFIIMGLVIGIAAGLATLAGDLSLAISCLMLLSYICDKAGAKFKEYADGHYKNLELIGPIAKKDKEIAGWTTAQIETYLTGKGVLLNSLPLDLLRTVNAHEPIRAFLPMIARHEAVSDLAYGRLESFRAKHSADKEFADWHNGWIELETQAMPLTLIAAILLEGMRDPTLRVHGYEDLGKLRMCLFEEREFERQLKGNSGSYFIFHDSNRAPLSFAELNLDLSPEAFRQKLFPVQIS